jgi:hypothetical protein
MSAKLSIVAQATDVELSSKANAIGVALGKMQKALSEANLLKDTINKLIVELHTAKAKVGIYRKDGTGCALATAFVDGCVEAGLSHSTAQKTYLPTFKKAVESGKPVNDWNGQRTKGKGKAKGKGKSELSELLVKAFNHDEGKSFEALCQSVEKGFYTDATFKTIYAGFVDYLQSEGYEIE